MERIVTVIYAGDGVEDVEVLGDVVTNHSMSGDEIIAAGCPLVRQNDEDQTHDFGEYMVLGEGGVPRFTFNLEHILFVSITHIEVDLDFGGIMAEGTACEYCAPTYWAARIQLTRKTTAHSFGYGPESWLRECGDYCIDPDCTIDIDDGESVAFTGNMREGVLQAVLDWGRNHQAALQEVI